MTATTIARTTARAATATPASPEADFLSITIEAALAVDPDQWDCEAVDHLDNLIQSLEALEGYTLRADRYLDQMLQLAARRRERPIRQRKAARRR